MISVDLKVSKADMDRLNATLEKYVVHCKGDLQKTLGKTAYWMVKALRASTKSWNQAPKKRPVVANPGYIKISPGLQKKADRQLEHIQNWYKGNMPRHKTGKKAHMLAPRQSKPRFATDGIKEGVHVFRPIYGAKTKTEANQSPARVIKRRGTADASWRWMLGKMGRPATGGDTGLQQKGDTVSAVEVKEGDNLFIVLTNRLKYIRKAFVTKGKTVDSVISRTTNQLRKEMERAADAAKKKAGL